MTTVAIICEYNPFHNGHKYQIDRIKEQFGKDTCIISLMSGNFTQRGDCAILDKGLRARCAIDAGASIVLELPFPYSSASAEFFAGSAVHMLNSLSCVDYLSFGSEDADVERIARTARIMCSEDFSALIKKYCKDEEYRAHGYPVLAERALDELKGSNTVSRLTPNNILAIEYIKALIKTNSKIKAHTIKRIGADFLSNEIIDSDFQSATAIREAIHRNDISALEYIPKSSKSIVLEALKKGEFPCNTDKLSLPIITSFRLSSHTDKENIHDVGGGLYNRLREKSLEANNIDTLVHLSETKKFTKARIRRGILFSFFGVTSSDLREPPMFTQLLGMDDIGRMKLGELRKRSSLPILTKPSATDGLCDAAKRQKERSDRADSVFQLTKPCPPSGSYAIKFTPYVKK